LNDLGMTHTIGWTSERERGRERERELTNWPRMAQFDVFQCALITTVLYMRVASYDGATDSMYPLQICLHH